MLNLPRNVPPLRFLLFLILVVVTVPGLLWLWHSEQDSRYMVSDTVLRSDSSATILRKARASYFQRLLRDPETGQIPPAIRKRELAYARKLPTSTALAAKSGSSRLFLWEEAGPNDVGGRTRALAVDRTNSTTILAGGVAGGIWKSTDQGESWELKTEPSSLTGVTYITQDPREGHTDTWYAVTGEFYGSNSDRGRRAPVYGQGLYTSLDSGESWTLLSSSENPTALDSPFDLGLKVRVSPTTGTLFIASQAFSLNRMASPEASPVQVLGTEMFPEWTDFDIASDGTMIAVTSEGLVNTDAESAGVFYSTDDGVSWQDITPANFPEAPARSVIAFAPSDPGLAYLWTFTGQVTPDNNAFGEEEVMQFYAFNVLAGTSEDRSANLPNFGGQVGHLYTQGSYDMILAVKPDDPLDVFIGGTNLYRSRDGFTTPANVIGQNWVGGYSTLNNVSEYNNHHPDQHALFFDPQNPNALWSGHDGGLSFVADVSPQRSVMPWVDKNNGYNVTQFYHVALAQDANDPRFLGGTQDNGSPFFTYDPSSSQPSDSRRVSSGDGGYAYLGSSYAISSIQRGELIHLNYNLTGRPLFAGNITPPGASNQLFITPFAVDPLDERIVYYPGGNTLWRGRSIPFAPSWSALSNASIPFGYLYTALATGVVSESSVLYLAASGADRRPLLFRLDEASASTSAPELLLIPSLPQDAYIHNIAVNPEDGRELIVVASNYNITGLYHSSDAGETFTAIEGNLTGTAQDPGPSLRSATILPVGSTTWYLLGTSTGVYATSSLQGINTVWAQEGLNEIGHTIIESITSRPSDGRVAVATHGRGVFTGSLQNPVSIEPGSPDQPRAFTLEQNYPNPFSTATTIRYSLHVAARINLSVFDVTGRVIQPLIPNRTQSPGTYEIDFNSGTLAGGMYIYTLEVVPLQSESSAYTSSKTMIISR